MFIFINIFGQIPKIYFMKKWLLGIFVGSTLFANAQVEITLSGSTTNIAGQTHVETSSTDQHLEVSLLFHNNTGGTVNWKIQRKIISQPAAWSNYVCWGAQFALGECYGASANTIWTTPDVATINDGNAGSGVMHILTSGSGTAKIRYYVLQGASNLLDSVDVEVTSTLSVKEIKNEVSVSLAPNPATENVTVNLNNAETATVKIVDVLGNIVAKEQIYSSKKFDVADFKNGVYFVIIDVPGQKSINRKLVVRH